MATPIKIVPNLRANEENTGTSTLQQSLQSISTFKTKGLYRVVHSTETESSLVIVQESKAVISR